MVAITNTTIFSSGRGRYWDEVFQALDEGKVVFCTTYLNKRGLFLKVLKNRFCIAYTSDNLYGERKLAWSKTDIIYTGSDLHSYQVFSKAQFKRLEPMLKAVYS